MLLNAFQFLEDAQVSKQPVDMHVNGVPMKVIICYNNSMFDFFFSVIPFSLNVCACVCVCVNDVGTVATMSQM